MTLKEGKLVPRMSCRRDSWKLDDFQQTTNIKIISTIKKISVVLMYCEKNRIKFNPQKFVPPTSEASDRGTPSELRATQCELGRACFLGVFGIGAGCIILTETYVIASIVTLRQYRKWVNTIVSPGIRRT